MEQTIIAHCPNKIIGLTYQAITCNEDHKIWLIAVNILLNNKIIEKIKLEEYSVEFLQKNAEEIALDYFSKKIIEPKKKNKYQTVNQDAKSKAASNLMKDLNI